MTCHPELNEKEWIASSNNTTNRITKKKLRFTDILKENVSKVYRNFDRSKEKKQTRNEQSEEQKNWFVHDGEWRWFCTLGQQPNY